MNINVSIIDQQVRALAETMAARFADELNIKNDEHKARSAAFVLLTLKTLLDLPQDEAFDCLTEGGSDFGVDAIHLSDVTDGEFTATLAQAKYKQKLEGNSNFEETGVIKAIQAIKYLFNPSAVMSVNQRLEARVEEIRSLIREGNLPRVRFILCNNGLIWTTQAQQLIDHERFPDRVRFEHVNHDYLVGLMQAAKPVQDTLRLSGKAIVEDFNFIRVMVGKVPVVEIADLLRRHGDRLLERNIRRYLGLVGNRVNEGIRQTLRDPAQRPSFY
ncbi:MAG: AIPR family protein, partial [Candidatus Didemnitutus sp.]|nr:AIPR family protein [Candidatus Didemnitutus sp.]